MRYPTKGGIYELLGKAFGIILILGMLITSNPVTAPASGFWWPGEDIFFHQYQEEEPIEDENIRLEKFNFPGKGEEMNHKIQVYLPAGYSNETKYPVLYLQDGGLLFDPSDGRDCMVDETLDDLQERGLIGDGIIVVGIHSIEEKRWDEYSPYLNDNMHHWVKPSANNKAQEGGEGDAYLLYIEKLVKHIDNTYSTLSNPEGRAIGGFSMGGLISLYAGLNDNQMFSKILAISPAVWFAETDIDNNIGNHNQLIDEIKSINLPQDVKIYIDIGVNEWVGKEQGEYSYPEVWMNGAIRLYKVLVKRGIPRNNIMLLIDKNGIHEPYSWANRIGPAILWLYRDIVPIDEEFELHYTAGRPVRSDSEVLTTEDSSFAEDPIIQQPKGETNSDVTVSQPESSVSESSSALDRLSYDSTFFVVVAFVLLILAVIIILMLMRQLRIPSRKK